MAHYAALRLPFSRRPADGTREPLSGGADRPRASVQALSSHHAAASTPDGDVVLVVVTVEAFRSFDLLFAMTRGGPGTASQTFPMLIFRYTFEFSRYGLGAAASYILVAIGMIITTSLLLRPDAPATIGGNRRRAGGPDIATGADRRRNDAVMKKTAGERAVLWVGIPLVIAWTFVPILAMAWASLMPFNALINGGLLQWPSGMGLANYKAVLGSPGSTRSLGGNRWRSPAGSSIALSFRPWWRPSPPLWRSSAAMHSAAFASPLRTRSSSCFSPCGCCRPSRSSSLIS